MEYVDIEKIWASLVILEHDDERQDVSKYLLVVVRWLKRTSPVCIYRPAFICYKNAAPTELEYMLHNCAIGF